MFNSRSRRILMVLMLILAVSATASENPDFDKAKAKASQLAESLQSYQITASLQMEQKPVGAPSGMKFEATQNSAARMPDRLVVSIESPMFVQTWGVGAETSWFYFAQQQVCYQGSPVELTRELVQEGEPTGLEEGRIFNFYAGVGEYLLTSDVIVEPETGAEKLMVNGAEVDCQVFSFAVTGEDGVSKKGSGTYWYDPQSGLVLKAAVTTLNSQNGQEIEGTMTSAITSFTLNKGVDEGQFSYTPPAEARVVDSFERLMNPDSMVGMTAPDITFTSFAGEPVKLKDYRGKVVFLDFWATWCGPCRMEMPHLQALHEELGSRGDVVFLGASNEPQKTIETWLAKNPYTFQMVLVKPEDAQGLFNVSSIPAGFVIDREGVIKAHMIGAQSEAQLRGALKKAGIE